jgi:hypothetical protein
MQSYSRNMERIRRGNPPELQANIDAAHRRLQARVRELRAAKNRGTQDAGHSGRHESLGLLTRRELHEPFLFRAIKVFLLVCCFGLYSITASRRTDP